MLSKTVAGIAPVSAPGFVIAHMLGGCLATLAIRNRYPHITAADASEVVMPHSDDRRRATAPAVADGAAR